MYVYDILDGSLVKVPRKTKKRAKKENVVITGRAGRKYWLTAFNFNEE